MTTNKKWEEGENPELVSDFKEIAEDPHADPCLKEFVKHVMEAPYYDTNHDTVRGLPLFELSSISMQLHLVPAVGFGPTVKAYSGYSVEVKIYGHIRLTDDEDNVFTLFERERKDAKPVVLRDGVVVILQKLDLGSPRCLPKTFKLHIYLKDSNSDFVIVDDWKSMSFTRRVDYDQEKSISCENSQLAWLNGYHSTGNMVNINYTIFQCAILAFVDVTVVKNESDGSDASDLCAKVSGTICATIKMKKEEISHVLFDESNPLQLNFGVLTKLSVFAVPVYSLLEIQANLLVDEEPVSFNALEFKPSDLVPRSVKEIVGQKCRIRVRLTWKHAFHKLPENYLREWCDVEGSSGEDSAESECGTECEDVSDWGKTGIEKPWRPLLANLEKRKSIAGRQKRLKLIEDDSQVSSKTSEKGKSIAVKQKGPELIKDYSQVCVKTSDNFDYYIQPHLQKLSKRRRIVSIVPESLVEVFAVSICSYDDVDGASSIYGEINCYDLFDSFNNFKRKEMKPGILHPRETGRCPMGSIFGMDFHLKDAKGREVSRGFLEYCEYATQGWYDRRICSVVPGAHGFAAVHYTIFMDAVQAKLKFILMPANGAAVWLCGKICATYSNYKYCTHYDKEYYQSTLFEKGKSEFVEGGGEVPLLKSVVAVPSNGSLIVKAGFRVSVEGKSDEIMRGKATFKAREREPKIIGGSKSSSEYHLLVSVEWGIPEYGLF